MPFVADSSGFDKPRIASRLHWYRAVVAGARDKKQITERKQLSRLPRSSRSKHRENLRSLVMNVITFAAATTLKPGKETVRRLSQLPLLGDSSASELHFQKVPIPYYKF